MAKMKINEKNAELIARHRYSLCCLMSLSASLLGFLNPVLSAFIAENVINNFNLKGIIPSLVSLYGVKATRLYLRTRVGAELKGGSIRAPIIWLQHRISKKLWWLEPMVDNWGWVGLAITRITGGVSVQASAAIASMIMDTMNALLSGVVYYFTRSYVLSLLAGLFIPSVAVVPWLTVKTLRYRRRRGLRLR